MALPRALLMFSSRRSRLLKFLLIVPLIWLFLFIFLSRSPTSPTSDPDFNTVAGSARKNKRANDPNQPHALRQVQIVSYADDDNAIPHVAPKRPEPNEPRHVLQPPRSDLPDPNGPGEMGKPVKLPDDMPADIKKRIDEGWSKNAFNQYVSDMISLKRALPDPRDDQCLKYEYNVKVLPPTDVIICFHNEAWSVLLRTVYSVLDRSPSHLIKHVILVDDASTMDHVKQPLDDYYRDNPKVKILRSEKRVGLIRARLLGFEIGTAPVATFLDSHCECMPGWLEPLLDRIAHDKTTVVCPVIDVIDDNTLELHHGKAASVQVGGFDWNLQFNWHAIPEVERKRRKYDTDPVRSPTMAGGLFSIDREFFKTLGTYDDGFDIWGGENLELSFKSWMCGGTLEIIPCSHVGHIFRKRSPYKWRTGVNVLKRNSIRLAEVWLDDYKKYYYDRINFNLGDYGNISNRTALRQNLQCKSFKWYLDHVYPELFVPGDAVGSGEIRNEGDARRWCLDSPARKRDYHKPVGVYPCHTQVRNKADASRWCLDAETSDPASMKHVGVYPCHNMGGNQYWSLSRDGEIRRDEACIDYAGQDVVIYPCHGLKGNQLWQYNPDRGIVLHVNSNKCMEMHTDHKRVVMSACDEAANERQKWKFQNYNASKLHSPSSSTKVNQALDKSSADE